MTGADRAIACRVALGTGCRANEIRSLTPRGFVLDGLPSTGNGPGTEALRATGTDDTPASSGDDSTRTVQRAIQRAECAPSLPESAPVAGDDGGMSWRQRGRRTVSPRETGV